MLGIRKHGHDGRVGLAWARFKIRVLRIPTGEDGVVLGDSLICVSPGRPRWVQVQVVLKDLEVQLLQPRLKKPGLPKPG